MIVHLTLLVLVSQAANQAADWIHITSAQAEAATVVNLEKSRQPTLATCREVSFASNGLDVVTESQFTIVVTAVVAWDGQVQRFRVDRKPALPIDFPTALKEWRYSRMERKQPGEAFETTFALAKPLGAARTLGCEQLKRRQ